MYSSRGSGAYGQSYTGQSAYGQNLSANYSGASVGGHDATPHSAASRHSGVLGSSQDADVGSYRAHTAVAQYGGQYSSVYGSAAVSTAQQTPSLSTKGAGSSALDARGGYSLGVSDSPKFASSDYLSSSSTHGYGHKSDQLYGDKSLDYSGLDRRQYGERQSGYIGRDLSSDPTGRYATDSVGYSHQHQATLLRQEQLLKSQSLQAASLDGGTRQTDYLAARAAASRHPTQDLMSYGGRIDSEPHASSMLSATSYSGQHAPSILGAAPRRNVDDLLYSQNASNPGYGVSLPPGRDYASGKGIHGNAMDLDYPANPLSSDRKDDRASYLRDFELREEERRRDRLRDRDRDRERDKERERLRERERDREKEREKERMERREKERERDRKRALEVKLERTPVRSSKDPRSTSKDPRGSSLTKETKSSRRDSPHRGSLHRHRSPVKEKRREYICKVYPSCLVNIERDYLSIDKRYPRLFISPEFSKVVVNWPKENLKLSMHTPVSFEHDFVEEEGARDSSSKLLTVQPTSSEQRNTVWNAKVVLMNGLSRGALEELSSDKLLDDRIPHICNFLRFAILKKDHSFMAVGGPWEPADGGDPSNDDSSLIRAALRFIPQYHDMIICCKNLCFPLLNNGYFSYFYRYTKDIIQLDLQKCQHWNRFLEIHYDRIGKDGFFSHKEITVLYVPDLSECLPSLDEWRDQWLAHKKAVAERERQISLKKEKSRAIKESNDKSDKRKDSAASEKPDVKKKEKDNSTVKEESEKKAGASKKTVAKKDSVDVGEAKSAEKKPGETTPGQPTGSVKSVKKKIIKKIVKKVVSKTNDSAKKQSEKSGEKVVADKVATSDVPVDEVKPSVDPTGIQTTGKDIVAADIPVAKTDDEGKNDKEISSLEGKPLEKLDPAVNIGTKDATVKTIKKKIIKRVPKKKVVDEASKSVVNEENVAAVPAKDGTDSTGKQAADADTIVPEGKKPAKVVVTKRKLKTPSSGVQDDATDSNKRDTKSDKKDEENAVAAPANDVTQSTGKQATDADTKIAPVVKKKIVKVVPKKKLKVDTSEKPEGAGDSNKNEKKSDNEDKKDGKATEEKSGSKIAKQKTSEKDTQIVKGKLKVGDKSKDEKVTKEKDGKDEPKSKSSKEVKEKRKSDEPPRHPGLILKTKSTKDSKLRSLSLSLDSLLDYTDKDVEESTLELSLFAESFYEMLQFQMGSRILNFLQKLREKFVIKRAQRKRQREEEPDKDSANKTPTKRQKGDDPSVKSETKVDTSNPTQADNDKTVAENDNSSNKEEDVKMENASDEEVEPEEEDPEEDPEEEMENDSPQHDSSNDNNAEQEADAKNESENVASNEKPADETSKGEIKVKDEVKESKDDVQLNDEKESKVKKDNTVKKETPAVKEAVVDKELLKAFRFFDRNRVGYIRVEDMRIIIHNLGMFLSHRDVKELVQSALLESNTGRDDRILYIKLARMSDV
ncbi:protein SHORT ROOT IN SALT MEDIUM 1 isoform X1 [Trifolium pratense]|uniref:protein SHORT ROOT IN SALT MEDIUM 1 isoform X1 n=1 Tax=Trifolium pratense TaxID=57577 RepID=UPI001E68FFE7|nr:protein SHORT ROOT IN SALT MEDIUM 1 isoform X1 [Trifolium pratense]